MHFIFTHNRQANSFNVMNNTTIINIFNDDNSYVDNIKTQHCQNMAIITKKIKKFKLMIKMPVVTIHTFFTNIPFSKINFFACIYSIRIKKTIFISFNEIFNKII